jgi:hypothetical protein
MNGTRRIRTRLGVRPAVWAVLSLSVALLGAPVRAGSDGPAPWDADRARAMFAPSGPVDSVGLSPVWALVVRDSGRSVEVLRNRFRDSTISKGFPLDSIVLRRSYYVRSGGESRETMFYFGGVATLPVRPNGDVEPATILWVSPLLTTSEPRPFAGVGPIPHDGSQYCLSADGKSLLVLRSMHHGVNVWGETGSFGLLDLFDVSRPRRPRRIGPTLEADGPLDNGVVSADGSRIAVQISLPAGVGWLGSRVVVFERTGSRLSGPRVVVPRTTEHGLHFEGEFLFVGMQRPPMHMFVEMATTETLSLFDLRP